jgi:hypothetical protein
VIVVDTFYRNYNLSRLFFLLGNIRSWKLIGVILSNVGMKCELVCPLRKSYPFRDENVVIIPFSYSVMFVILTSIRLIKWALQPLEWAYLYRNLWSRNLKLMGRPSVTELSSFLFKSFVYKILRLSHPLYEIRTLYYCLRVILENFLAMNVWGKFDKSSLVNITVDRCWTITREVIFSTGLGFVNTGWRS